MSRRPGVEDAATAYRVPADSRVYAIGDIHGRSDLLRKLHDMIIEDARGAQAARKVVVYLGDYVDRGPDCRGVIETLLDDPLPGFESFHLLGNHDLWLVEFLENTRNVLAWLYNGGDTTLESYGVPMRGFSVSTANFEVARSAFLANFPAAHAAFFRELKLTHREGDYLFVHAGIRPGRALDAQETQDLLWIREEFLHSETDHGVMVVHGHTPAHDAQIRGNRIGIDTGAFASGCLTCLVLEGAQRRILQTGAPRDVF